MRIDSRIDLTPGPRKDLKFGCRMANSDLQAELGQRFVVAQERFLDASHAQFKTMQSLRSFIVNLKMQRVCHGPKKHV